MAYYRMSGSSKGELHGASVLVTVDGEITSGDTVTLSATGYSQTKTLSDVKTALFTDILESGTYTATYKTYTNTVDVSAQDVLDKTTKNVTIAQSVTLTLTIEGAKEDNIKIYDSANTQVGSCVFASGQTTGTVDLEIPPTGGTYKFESTVAKDTETGTSNYSKNVSLTNTSSSVKVMPDNCLYWYGNECTDVTGGWSGADYNYGSGYDIPDAGYITKNTNSFNLAYAPSGCSYMGTNNKVLSQNDVGKIKVIYRFTEKDINQPRFLISDEKSTAGAKQYLYDPCVINQNVVASVTPVGSPSLGSQNYICIANNRKNYYAALGDVYAVLT